MNTYSLKTFEVSKLKSHGSFVVTDTDFLDLLSDIEKNGLNNPPLVTQRGFIKDGDRRIKALSMLGIKTVECRVYTGD